MRLATHGLSLRFGRVLALDEVTVEVPPASRLLVWGPAAGGKTSLLKCLAGLVQPTGGEVTWDGRVVASLRRAERRAAQAAFGMVFQTDALFDSMSVLDNVLLPLRRRGVGEDEARARALEALGAVGLGDAADRSPEVLSGGMKKRAGIARAVVARPDVLLADDPFAGLDPTTAVAVARVLLEASAYRTLVVALPDPVPFLPFERRLHLVDGRVEPDEARVSA